MVVRKSPPALSLFALEPARALCELALGSLLQSSLARVCPPGDGHPVLVLPGLGAHDVNTLPLRSFLTRLGYQALPWQQGFNLGAREGLEQLLDKLEQQVEASVDKKHRKVSLVGWSLGGVFARELAKRVPRRVRQVVTLGSPCSGTPASTRATKVFELLSGQRLDDDPALLKRVREPPPVPTTSVFSKTDGVVAWPASVQASSALSENIPVSAASHLGLICNPLVLYVVANRLAQIEGRWRPMPRRQLATFQPQPA